MAASVWMKFSKVLMPSCVRPSAEMMPIVTVWPTPNGLPMASTTSPTAMSLRCANSMVGRFCRSTFSTARSVSGSLPIRRAFRRSPLTRMTSIWVPSPST